MSEKVLLVDDDKDFVDALTKELKNQNMAVSNVISSKAALSIIESKTFDAVILSLMLPEADGLKTIKAVKKLNSKPEIILLTNNTTIDKGIKAMKFGAGQLLNKSMDICILKEKITRVLMKKTLLVEKNI